MNRFLRKCSALSALTAITSVHGAIQIADFSSMTNDRFANDPAFIANNFDLSGVAISNGGQWVTMISDNVFVSSGHYKPGAGASVTFYANNDPTGVTATHTVGSNFQKLGDTDIYLGTLTAPIGTTFTYYNFATEDITTGTGGGATSFSKSPYYKANAYVFGKSPTTDPETGFPFSQRIAVGRNELDRWVTDQLITNQDDSFHSQGDSIGAFVQVSGETGFVDYEADLRVGDSGAPLMVDAGDGTLTIVGNNWFSSAGNLLGATYFGNYDEEIQAFIDANAVPEPNVFALVFGLSALASVSIRRRPYIR